MRRSGRSVGAGIGRDAPRTVLLAAGVLVVALTLGVASLAWAASKPSVSGGGLEELTATSATLAEVSTQKARK